VQLNRAVAIAMRDGPEVGLTHMDAVLEHGELANCYLVHSAVQICTAGSAAQLRLGPLVESAVRGSPLLYQFDAFRKAWCSCQSPIASQQSRIKKFSKGYIHCVVSRQVVPQGPDPLQQWFMRITLKI